MQKNEVWVAENVTYKVFVFKSCMYVEKGFGIK